MHNEAINVNFKLSFNWFISKLLLSMPSSYRANMIKFSIIQQKIDSSNSSFCHSNKLTKKLQEVALKYDKTLVKGKIFQ